MKGTVPQRGLFRSIRTKLIVSFCLLFLVVWLTVEFMHLKGVPFTTNRGWQGHEKEQAFDTLNLIADLKKERLLRWIEERRDDTSIAADNSFTVSAVVEIQRIIGEFQREVKEDIALWEKLSKEKNYIALREYLEKIKNTYGVYDRLLIIDRETDKIIISTDDIDLGTYPSHAFHFAKTMHDDSKGIHIDDIEICGHKKIPVLYFSNCIHNNKGVVIAVIVLVVDTEDMIRPILHTGEGLGKTGEVLLVNKDVRIITSLKHPLADGTTPGPLEYQIKAESALRAARGEEGIIAAEDYRGEPVLAAYRYIPITSEWGWGMVVKQDRAELFAPLWENTRYSLLVGVAGILGFIGFTVVLAKKLTGPILALSDTAAKVTGGDLDARAPVTTSDEVGTLTLTFNSMIGQIKDWHKELEDEVKTRTDELKITNETLLKEIDGRIKVEQVLLMEKQRFDNISNYANCGIFLLDNKTKVIFANKLAQEWFGPIDELKQKKCWEIFKLKNPEKECAALEAFRSGTAVHGESFTEVFHGGEKHFYSIASPIKDNSGRIYQIAEVVVDITERKRAEEQLKEYSEHLEEMVDERALELKDIQEELVRKGKLAVLGQLSGGVGHELRNPLGVISNAVYYLKMVQPDPDEKTKEYLDIISSEIITAEKIVSDLLDFSRINKSEKKNVEVSDMISQVIKRQPPPEEIKLSTEIPAELSTVFVDSQQIQQVLTNLVSNACQAMPDGGDLIIKAQNNSNNVLVSVSDTGCGISDEDRRKIFEPLYTTKARGIGLGLSVTRNLVALNEGSIELISKEGKGSTFTILLPIRNN